MDVMCRICKKVYSHQRTLNAHMRKKHNRENLISFEYDKFSNKCLEGCNISFNKIKSLRHHLEKHHNVIAEQEIKEFPTSDEFTCWLTNLNKDCIQYVFSHSELRRKGYKTSYYYCNRTGKYMPSVLPQNRKRKLKSQGSCKINVSCTSVIIAVQNLQLNTLSVTYYKTHYAHEKEIQHIRISKNDHTSIAAKLMAGGSIKRVLDDNRQNVDSKLLKSKDLITRRDVHNVKRRFHIDMAEDIANNGVLHENDAVSVELWAEEYKKHNFLYYKKQGEEHPVLDIKDICLIFMNRSQEQLLKSFGNKIVCVDSTYSLNKYDFQLTTVIIIDDYGEEFPGACMFSNRIDTTVNEIFFDAIKQRVGLLSPRTFMTDITPTCINAWQKVMEHPKYQLYCSWHLDWAWRSNLNKISNQEKRRNVYNSLKYLQYMLDESKFVQELNSTVALLWDDEETVNFAKYFQENYLNNYEKWASCFRKYAGINTNMPIESMHKTIKYYYLEAKKIKRLDEAISSIISYIRNKIIDRIIKNTKGLNSNHISEINKRHKISQTSSFEIEISTDLWRVIDENKEVHSVLQKIDPAATCCRLICKECNICIHTYECTCIDYCIRYTICKHIHSVVSLGSNSNSVLAEEIKALGVQFTAFDYQDVNEDILLHIKNTMKNCYNFLISRSIRSNEVFISEDEN